MRKQSYSFCTCNTLKIKNQWVHDRCRMVLTYLVTQGKVTWQLFVIYFKHLHMSIMHIHCTEAHRFQPFLSLGQLEGLPTPSAPWCCAAQYRCVRMAPNTTRILLQSTPPHTDKRKCYGIKVDSTIPTKSSSSYKASLVFHMHLLQATLDHFLTEGEQ